MISSTGAPELPRVGVGQSSFVSDFIPQPSKAIARPPLVAMQWLASMNFGLCSLRRHEQGPRSPASLLRSLQHPTHRALHRVVPCEIQGFLVLIKWIPADRRQQLGLRRLSLAPVLKIALAPDAIRADPEIPLARHPNARRGGQQAACH